MSESKISKKYIGTGQVGSDQIELENNLPLKSRNAEGTESVHLMELDENNLFQLIQHPYLPGPATSSDQAARKAEVDTAQETADSALSVGNSALASAEEALNEIDQLKNNLNGQYEYLKVELSAQDISNQYIDLPSKAVVGSVRCSSNRVVLIVSPSVDNDADFKQDNDSLVTRLIFQGPSASMGNEALEQDQVLFFNYVKIIE